MAPAIAAPVPPKVGINIIFNMMFIILPIKTTFWKIFCFPVIWSIYPTLPTEAFTNCPNVKIIKAGTPFLNSLPKILSIYEGKSQKLNNIGKDVQKINFVDCWANFFNPSKSFFPQNSANFGAAIEFIAPKVKLVIIDNRTATL